jgi:hypothetical protein
MLNRVLKIALLALVVMLLNSCYGSVAANKGLTIYVTDAPIDNATAVNISIASIELDGDAGDSTTQPQFVTFSPATQVDVYSAQGGAEAALITYLPIATGFYTSMKVTLVADSLSASSSITLPDGTHILYIPNGDSSVVTVPISTPPPPARSGMPFASGGIANLTIDFDLRASIIQDPNDSSKYLLIPCMRAVQNELSGTITGGISTALESNNGSGCVPAVYAYQWVNSMPVTPTDLNLNATPGSVQPYATALVGLNGTTQTFNFSIAYLPAGQYTLAFTCNADQDIATQDNSAQVNFTSVVNATVTVRNVTFVAFK